MDRGKAVLSRRRLIAFSAASVFAPNVVTRAARAEAWPNRSVRMIVPLAAGGPTDSVARVLSEQLSKRWGQQVVIENKSGGGTNIGNAYVAHADPDGYTVLYGTSSLAVNATLYHALDYDPVADLAPVSLVAKFPFFMFVPNSLPAKTVAEFVAYVKSRPGKLVMGSPGTGSAPHLAEEFFLQKAGIQMTHAPYRGAAPAFIDLIPGRIDCYFGSGELLTYSRSGQVRALGTTGSTRAPAEPDLPTIAEAGVAGYVVDSWQGVFVPKKTPPDIVKKMSADIVAALADPATAEQLARSAYTARGSSPEELRDSLKADAEKWNAVIKTAGLKID
jgi:tripartite-type tricarboxylate transporter receptor subunit TctC